MRLVAYTDPTLERGPVAYETVRGDFGAQVARMQQLVKFLDPREVVWKVVP